MDTATKILVNYNRSIGERITKGTIIELEGYAIDRSNGKWIDVDYRGKARYGSIDLHLPGRVDDGNDRRASCYLGIGPRSITSLRIHGPNTRS